MTYKFSLRLAFLAKVLGIAYLFSVPVSGYLGWLGYGVGYHFFKISFFLNFLFLSIFILRFPLSNFRLILSVFIFLCLSIVGSIIYNEYLSVGPFFAHLFLFLVIIIGFGSPSGVYMVLGRPEIKFDRYFKFNAWLLFLFFVFYFLSFKLGIIPYWGLSSVLPLVLPFFLVRDNRFYILLTLAACLLSGKRSIILICVLQIIFYYSVMLKGSIVKKIYLLSLVLVLLTIVVAFFPSMFVRFGALFANDGPIDYSAITSGRFDEIVIFYEKFSSDWLGSLFGFGLGSSVNVDYAFGSSRALHYSHFSPFGIMLIGGIFLAVFVYSIFLINLILALKLYFRSRSKLLGYLILCGCYLLVMSFSGPALFNDVVFWLIFGFLVFCNFNKRFDPDFEPGSRVRRCGSTVKLVH